MSPASGVWYRESAKKGSTKDFNKDYVHKVNRYVVPKRGGGAETIRLPLGHSPIITKLAQLNEPSQMHVTVDRPLEAALVVGGPGEQRERSTRLTLQRHSN